MYFKKAFLLILMLLHVEQSTPLSLKKIARKITHIGRRKNRQNKNYQSIQNNFYEVEKNTFYRSKQLSSKRLRHYINRFKIKTVINLRGINKNAEWWRREVAIANECGIKLFHIPMSAKRLPHKRDLLTLLNLYKTAKRPILVHCQGGADRTGEASALWILDQQKGTLKTALRQLSIRYGHIWFRTPAKRLFIKLWQGRNWASSRYDPTKYHKYYPEEIQIENAT